jgi:hypothetical protein
MNLAHSEAIKRGKQRAREKGRLVGSPQRVSDTQIINTLTLQTEVASAMLGLTRQWLLVRRKRVLEKEQARKRAEAVLAKRRAAAALRDAGSSESWGRP